MFAACRWREASEAEMRIDKETPLDPLGDGYVGSNRIIRLWSPLVPYGYFGHAMLIIIPRSEKWHISLQTVERLVLPNVLALQ